jgi:hypothetical protein
MTISHEFRNTVVARWLGMNVAKTFTVDSSGKGKQNRTHLLSRLSGKLWISGLQDVNKGLWFLFQQLVIQ